MRLRYFLEEICKYNHNQRGATKLATQKIVNGGWEVWLQVEWAMYLIDSSTLKGKFEREKLYPNSRERCDFYFERLDSSDPTYVELKCMNLFTHNAMDDAFARLQKDIDKIKRHPDDACFATLVYYGGEKEIFHRQTQLRTGHTNGFFVNIGSVNNKLVEIKDARDVATPDLFLVGITVT